MSKLDDIQNELATSIHNLIPGDVGSMDRVFVPIDKSKRQIKDLFLELTNPEYERAFNAGDTEAYEMWVRVRQRVNEL